MAQFARPSTDTVITDWLTQAGSAANLYQTLDETVADDADYIKTPQTPQTEVFVTKLTSVVDPLSSASHTVRYRYGKDIASGDQVDFLVELRQGYVNEGSPGTLIHAATHTDVAVYPVAGTFTLSGAEADSITDYTDLYLRFVADTP